jgi:hypothetical protein
VPILGIALGFDRLAVPHARFTQVNMNIESLAQPVRNYLQVQFALRRDDGLVQFRIDHVQKGRILMMQRRQAGSDFVFLAFDTALE